jgi:hypothetical protein
MLRSKMFEFKTMIRKIIICGVCLAAQWAACAHFSSFQAGDGGWQMAALAVGNIDADPELEIVVPYRNSNGQWLLDAFNPNGTRLPGFPFNRLNGPINASPTLADLDGDGVKEIIFTQGNNIVALKGNGIVLWTQPVNASNYVPDAGFQAVTNGFYLSGLGIGLPVLLPTLPLTSEFFSEVSPPIVVDVEGDGTAEVLTAWKIDPNKLSSQQDYNPFINDVFGLSEWGQTGEVWSGGVVFSDARTGAKKFIYHFHQLVESGLAVGQVDADSPLEVFVLNDADSIVAFDKTLPAGLFGKGMLHKKFGKNLRLLSGSYQTGVDVHTTDLDGDGFCEVLVPSTQINPNWQPSETILDDDGAILWREWKQSVNVQNVHGWFNNAALIPVNPDHDNHIDVLGFTHSPEITFRYWDGVKLVNHPGWPKNFSPLLPTPPVMGDVDGDGEEDIIIGTYDPARNPSSGNLQIFALDGTQKFSISVPGGLKHIPTISDTDGDGANEVIYRALDGKVYIQNFGGGSPANISWATHRGNAQRDGNFRRSLFPPGTPVVASKEGGQGRATLSWRLPSGFTASGIKVFRADKPEGPFAEISALAGSATSFTDGNLALGGQFIYEIAAVYPSGIVRSAPAPILSQLNNNLVANGGFEEDDDSHWDKWFTGEIPWNNMIGSSAQPHAGAQSMEIKLQNHSNNSTITQYSHYGTPEDYIKVTPGTLYSFGGYVRSGGLTQPSVHWLEWDSSRTGENTDNRPGLPWPNYFTPALKAGTAATPWTYLNRVFEMPAGFSNVELRHRYTINGSGSGSVYLDDIFFRPVPAPNDSRWQQWIAFGSRWRYFTTVPPQGWSASDFNDAAWPEAPAKFGQGTGPKNIRTAVPKNQPAYYFRQKFTVPAGGFDELLLSATCTDDYGGIVYPMRLWLNGTEVISGGIEAVSGDGNVLKYFDLAAFAKLVRPGENTIAIMLQNTWQATWDNVAFDVALKAIPASGPLAAVGEFTRITRGSDGLMTLTITASAASTWRLESSDPAQLNNWQPVDTISFVSAGSIAITDAASHGPSRIYRLVRL